MKATLFIFLLTLATGLTAPALGQTRTSVKPATKSKSTAAKAKPSKPAASRPATKPDPKPTPTATIPPEKTPMKLEIPGVAPQVAPSFARGTVAVNLGLGVGTGYGYGQNYEGSAKSSPAFSLSAEKGILEGIGPGTISVGGLLGYKSNSYNLSVAGESHLATWRNIYVAARAAYHYNFTDNPRIDTYAGPSLAVRFENYSDDFSGDLPNAPRGSTNLDVGIFAGGRYLLTDNLGAFAELGYDMSYLKFGVTAKF